MTGTSKGTKKEAEVRAKPEVGQGGPILEQSEIPLQLHLKDLQLRERHAGRAVDHRTLQKLGSSKYPFRIGTNIPGLDEFSRGRMDCNGK